MKNLSSGLIGFFLSLSLHAREIPYDELYEGQRTSPGLLEGVGVFFMGILIVLAFIYNSWFRYYIIGMLVVVYIGATLLKTYGKLPAMAFGVLVLIAINYFQDR